MLQLSVCFFSGVAGWWGVRLGGGVGRGGRGQARGGQARAQARPQGAARQTGHEGQVR